jgi:hypothetical protein
MLCRTIFSVYLRYGTLFPQQINRAIIYIALNEQITPRRTLLPEKLRDPQLVKKLPHFMETEGSLQHSQAPATCPYPKPEQSRQCFPITLLEDHF